MVNKKFVALCSRAWCLQILCALGGGTSARVSPLAHELGAGRTAVSSSLRHLVELGYMRRMPGHGHPLRPEYVLTEKGEALSAWAAQLGKVLQGDCWPLARRTWTLPVLRAAAPVKRFAEIRLALSPVTDRALSQSLQSMCARDWLCRIVDTDASPPSVSYAPSGRGKKLSPILQRSFQI